MRLAAAGNYPMETIEGRNPVKPLGGNERRGMEIMLPEDKCDPMWMETTEGEEESAVCYYALYSTSEEASSLMLSKAQNVEDQETNPARHATVRKRCLVEVFAVLFLQKEETRGVRPTLEDDLVLWSTTCHRASPKYVLYDISCDNGNLQINSEDHLMLTGPDCGIEVEDIFSVTTVYHGIDGTYVPSIVWDSVLDCSEIFTCNWLESKHGFMIVKFAVYRDGLEAHLEVTISDLELHGMSGVIMPLQVYGTVRTSNNAVPHSQAKSYLFDHVESDNCAILKLDPSSKAEGPLPLSRRVTVIPRESTLIVDVSLSLRCTSGDISIANKSVSFHASTRSNSEDEERIIKGCNAKVKVKVTWREAFEYDKEEHEKELTEDGEAVDVECDGEDDEEAESEDISDDYSSFETEYVLDDNHSSGSHKLSRLSSSQDISTRSNDCHTTEAMEITDQEQGACFPAKSLQRFKRHYLEVFSVKLLEVEISKMDEIYGFIMIDTGGLSRLLFRRVRGYPSRIDSEGFSILEGPRRCGWSVYDEVYIVPLLFKYQGLEFTDAELRCVLWCNSHYDKFLCKTLNTDVGKIAVNFAIYEDGVEVHLSLMLTDCSFSWARVHGTIAASNSMFQNSAAESFVLKKDKAEADRIIVGPGKEISLPLSRPIVAVPFGSILTLSFKISSEDEPIIHQEFKFPVQLVDEYERTLPGIGCGVKVKLRYFSYQGCQYMDDDTSFF